jgi:peptide/nickel transport system substrate-binding protein
VGLERRPDGSFSVMTRRDSLKAMTLIAAAASGSSWALAACGDDDDAEPAAASGQPKRGGTLTFAVDGLTGNLDPGIYTTFGGIMGTNLVGKCLTFVDYHSFGDEDPAPALATEWEVSSNGKVYRFHLRPDVKFHDGNTVTADDCVRSFTRLMDPDDPTRPAGTYAISEIGGSNIKKVRAVDDATFEVTLGAPDVVLPVRFGRYNATILSAAAIEEYGKDIGTQMITAGPFQVVDYTPNQGMRFRSFREYYEDPPYLDEVVMQIVPDSATLKASLQSGSVDATSFVAFSDLPDFSENAQFVVDNPEPIITLFLGMNLRSAPLNDIRIRQAINYAIDRQAIAEAVFFGFASGTPAGIMPPPVVGHDESLSEFSTQDLDRAQQLLAEAGDPGPIRFHTANTGIWPKVGQIIVQNLEDLGLTIRADYVDPATDSARTFDAEQHDLFMNNRGGALADPASWTANYESASDINKIWWGIADELPEVQARIDKLITDGQRTSNPEERQEIYSQFQRILLEEVTDSAILAYYAQVTVKAARVQELDGKSLNAWALYAQRTWLA